MSFNPLDIYARASRRLPLTPAERAALKTVDQLILASIAGAIIAVGQAALGGGASLSFTTLGHVFVYALATALLTGLTKLFRASGDVAFAALANALDRAAGRLPQPPLGTAAASPAVSALSAQRVSGTGPTGATGLGNTGPLARAQRLANLSGSYPPVRPGSGNGASTQPTRAVSAASSGAIAPQMKNRPPETPAPSQRVVAPPPAPEPQVPTEDAEDENGPPTVEMAAVRVGAGPIAPPAPVSPSEWLVK